MAIDIMYSELCMEKSTYHELMKRARNDLAIAIESRRALVTRLEETESEIAQLKRLIGGIYAYVEQADDENELCAGDGLKEAICTALRSTSEDVTISEILGILKELQFPIEHHQNPLGSVYTTVTRLMEEGEVVAGQPKDEKKTYRWARINLKISPHKVSDILPLIGQVFTFKDSKKRSR
jgi:hypothetical protein